MLCNFRMFDCETSVWSFLWFETEIICVTKHGQHKALLFDLMIFVNSNKRIEHLILRTIARERSLTHKHSCTLLHTGRHTHTGRTVCRSEINTRCLNFFFSQLNEIFQNSNHISLRFFLPFIPMRH